MKTISKAAAGLVGAFLCFVGSGEVQARQWKVGIGAGFDFSSIQQAVNAATNGDVIKIADGRYTEQIRIEGKDLTLSGSGPLSRPQIRPETLVPNGTAPDGSAISAAILVEGGDVVLRNLAVIGFAVRDFTGDISAGVAFVGPASSGTLRFVQVSQFDHRPISGLPETVACTPRPIPADYRAGSGILALHSGAVLMDSVSSGASFFSIAAICADSITVRHGVLIGRSDNRALAAVLIAGDAAVVDNNSMLFSSGFGVAVFGNFALVKHNTIEGAATGIALFGNNNTVFKNEFIDVAVPVLDEGEGNIVK